MYKVPHLVRCTFAGFVRTVVCILCVTSVVGFAPPINGIGGLGAALKSLCRIWPYFYSTPSTGTGQGAALKASVPNLALPTMKGSAFEFEALQCIKDVMLGVASIVL
jgi:hypothetical protein